MRKLVYISIGFISIFLGIVGMAVPVLPTTPFLLAAVWCFSRSSDKYKRFLLTNKLFGKYFDAYYRGEGISKSLKSISVALLWISIQYSNFFVLDNNYIKAILTFTAIFVTVHILGNPTKENIKYESNCTEGKASISNS